MVSAWAADMGLLLGQCKVDGKSNEIAAIAELLRLLHLKGCIVTINTIGYRKDVAQQLHEHGADYVLSLKGNQRRVHARGAKHFEVQDKRRSGSGEHLYRELQRARAPGATRLRLSPVPEGVATARYPLAGAGQRGAGGAPAHAEGKRGQ